ncbi:dsDNA bind domain containing protein [Trichuris trichiura]|uniref:DsDNA bind domain containing protein n=1 Tax=Trichuris trichiura TaxID=36087 RepID=A0A077Z0P1_TRITR|nr:dsDNA bind domain containing protein [Trichuris trichiura]
MSQCLDQEARSRLNTLALAKPEKAKAVEGLIIQMAQCGRIRGKLGDAEFKSLLDNVNARFHEPQVSVKFDRRRTALDSDDEL